MLQVKCQGTPKEIGHQHGSQAREKVAGSITFYQNLFQKTCSLDWDAVKLEAAKYVRHLESLCPRYVEEMRGLADGADVEFLDIVALNVRTEITFGLFTDDPSIPVEHDGCTSLACRDASGNMFLSQNWDWQVAQAENLFICHISQPGTGLPDITMVTEAGVIGKIGFNSNGVGVCLNAIRARGVDISKLPTHLALRTALESESARSFVEKLQAVGSAGSGHILVSDGHEAFGLECSSIGNKIMEQDADGTIIHGNHMILEHPGLDERPWLPDSWKRVERMSELLSERKSAHATVDDALIYELFQDEKGYPGSINRRQIGTTQTQTLFNIIMDLGSRKVKITVGRPHADSERREFTLASTTH